MARKKGNAREVGRKIDYLGYQFDYDKTLLRKRTKKKFAQKLNNVKSNKRKKEIMASYWGQCIHGDCRNLWNKLTNNYMGFAKKGIGLKQTTKDGKRYFDQPMRSISMLVGKELMILDFEANIPVRKTETIDDTKPRYAVLAKIIEDGIEKEIKFITSSFFIISILNESRCEEEKGNKIFPVDNVAIERVQLSGRSYTYKFTNYK